ncbi:hypothetical protein FHR81_003267 [Actinoalloteichus hoggarensis]|uniref:hypothetical protein n=1 Tax=Actinoalloteichus hoggarensis TaxID=1470176 RepID=UPI001814DF4E|nr:hypothetical protein [Actinoalloteichus hoggarensis]MBB5922215.1 hypothetical protein [Actinoalloteichus hoggarensis]
MSLGAGVQSTTVLLLACEGAIPRFDHALFADTGWEPQAVYDNLARLRTHAADAGIPVSTVSQGSIRDDALNPEHRFASMPLHVRNPDGTKGLARRQCTNEYKIRPLKKAARALLGYPYPQRVPTGIYAEQAIGISTDEFARAKDADVRYLRNAFPLIDLGWTRDDCKRYLTEKGFGQTVKSACIGCPFHGNAGWRWLRDNDRDGWDNAVDFDHAIRHGHPHANNRAQPLHGQYYLHRSCVPLAEADLDPPGPRRALAVVNDYEPEGCSPWSCRSGESINTSLAA